MARWRFDGWRFFDAMFFHDFVDRASSVLEGHEGAPYYYLYFLQKHHYDWLLAAHGRAGLPAGARTGGCWRWWPGPTASCACWCCRGSPATFMLPTVVATKLGWYLNSFYPLFALAVAWAIVEAWQSHGGAPAPRARWWRRRSSWRWAWRKASWRGTRTGCSTCGVRPRASILAHAPDIASRQVYATTWPHADRFVVRTVGGHCVTAPDVDAFLAAGRRGRLLARRAWSRTPASCPSARRAGRRCIVERNEAGLKTRNQRRMRRV